MAKMMLPLLSLGSMLLATAEHSKLDCAVDGSKAFSDAADAAIYIWAATQRCDASKPAPDAKAPVGDPCAPQNRRLNPEGFESQRRLTASNAVLCTIDISSAVAAVGAMTNIIVEALDTCDVIHSADEECGELAGELTTAAASLAAGSAGIINACPNEFQPKPGNEDEPAGRLERKTDLGKCIVDAKGSLSGTFDAMESLKKISSRRRKTTHNALNTVSAFASLGSAVAAAVNDCSAYTGAGNNKADCVSNILGVVSQLHSVADIASSMANKCKASASRLYLEASDDESTSVVTSNSMSFTLAAFLPVAAVFGFVFGRRFGKTRANRDVEAMIQVDIE
jgi:hypothetical protein